MGVEDDTHLDTSVFGELTGAAGLILKTAAKPNQLSKYYEKRNITIQLSIH